MAQPFDPDSGDRTTSIDGLAEVRALLARRLPALKDASLSSLASAKYEEYLER